MTVTFVAMKQGFELQRMLSRVDFSGVDQFFDMMERLQAGRSYSDAEWDAFFAHPGYAALDRTKLVRHGAICRGPR